MRLDLYECDRCKKEFKLKATERPTTIPGEVMKPTPYETMDYIPVNCNTERREVLELCPECTKAYEAFRKTPDE